MNISNSPDNTNFQIGITIDPEKFKSILLKSRGFDPITQTSNANIFINNIDYSCNHIGLNIVVYSKSQNAVIDTFYVDTFCDPKTERNARI